MPDMTRTCCLGYIRKPPATTDPHVTEPGIKKGTSLHSENCFMLLKSICMPLVGHNSALEIVIFSFCEMQWKRYSNTAPASAINVMQ